MSNRMLDVDARIGLRSLSGSPEFYNRVIKLCELHAKKSADYIGGVDPFWNFITHAALKGCSVRDVFAFYQTGKDARLMALKLSSSAAMNESAEDTLMDKAVYYLLEAAFIDRFGSGIDKVLTWEAVFVGNGGSSEPSVTKLIKYLEENSNGKESN